VGIEFKTWTFLKRVFERSIEFESKVLRGRLKLAICLTLSKKKNGENEKKISNEKNKKLREELIYKLFEEKFTAKTIAQTFQIKVSDVYNIYYKKEK